MFSLFMTEFQSSCFIISIYMYVEKLNISGRVLV